MAVFCMKLVGGNPKTLKFQCNFVVHSKKQPKYVRYPRRTRLPPEPEVLTFRKNKNDNVTHEVLIDSIYSEGANKVEIESGEELVDWDEEEIEAISSLFQGRIPLQPGKPAKQRPLPLPIPHKIRPVGLPTTKMRLKSVSSQEHFSGSLLPKDLHKDPEFLTYLARRIQSLPSEKDVSSALSTWGRFLRKGSLSLTIKELGHMGLSDRALQTFSWAQKQSHLINEERITVDSHRQDISLFSAMDTKTLYDSTISIADGDVGESSSYRDRQEDNPSNVNIVKESGIAKELVMQMELEIACSSERLVNLNILMMHVAERASGLEAIASDSIMEEASPAVSTGALLEFDFLYEIFDSEVTELGDFIATLQTEILNAREMLSSGKHFEKSLAMKLERRLDDSEKSLKQSQEDVSDLRSQSANLRRILSCFRNEENSQEDDKDAYDLKNGNLLHKNAKIKMQTSEQQRHILRMLEKSLATEMNLEKKLIESKQTEEELKSRLHASAQEVLSLKEQATTLLERLFEADSAAEVLKGISREQMGRLQLSQFSLNNAAQREAELKSRIESSQSPTSKDKAEIALLRERIFLVEYRAESAELKCKVLEETNAKLKEEVDFIRNDCSLAEMVESLRKQLEEADIQLQQAAASVDASQEKQTMLHSSISDMQTVIDGLKSKVLKAETQADNAEDKWIMLSESNAELNDELNLLRGRLECLEASAQQAEEAKAATAKDINVRTKVIMDLVMRLAVERERLHKKVSSVMKENKFLMENLQETKKDKSLDTSDYVGKCNEQKEVKSSISTEELQKPPRDAWDAQPTSLGLTNMESKLETVRTVDAGQLNLKQFFIAILVLALSGLAFYLFNMQNCPF